MHGILSKEREFAVDLESGLIIDDEAGTLDSGSSGKLEKAFFSKLFHGVMNVDSTVKAENLVKLSVNAPKSNEGSPEKIKVLTDKNVEGVKSEDLSEKKMGKENRKKTSAKKPPKPPRPPRGLYLDAADQKLIKEIAQLAMIKRARIEHMKAKKMKTSKASSSSGSLIATLFTVLFCIVILFQGMSSGSSAVSFEGSPEAARATVDGFVSVQNNLNTPATDTASSGSRLQFIMEQVSSYDPSIKLSRAVG